jgi:hypothetical protein
MVLAGQHTRRFTAMKHADFERELKARAWRNDVGDECFYPGDNVVGSRKLIALLPVRKLDELASYQDAKHDRLGATRR